MPELPDLEVVRRYLSGVLPGLAITRADIRRPLVVRDTTGDHPGQVAIGRSVRAVGRRGKYLWLDLGTDLFLAINPKLAGRLAWHEKGAAPRTQTVLVLGFAGGEELHYLDAKDMGQVYLTANLATVPGFAAQGPDALDPALSPEVFAERLRPFRGEIKGVLTRQEFVAGIGNAYADEVLFRAGISPFRKRTKLSPEEVARLYASMRQVLEEAIDTLCGRVGSAIEVEVRDFLQVHGRGGTPCPRCGRPISELTARQRITSFCRGCQPGTLVRN